MFLMMRRQVAGISLRFRKEIEYLTVWTAFDMIFLWQVMMMTQVCADITESEILERN